jgi:Na+/melibiose symporter-like transporter
VYRPNLFYFFLVTFFLLVSIALTVTNTFSAYFIVFCVGQINRGTFGAVLSTQYSQLPEPLRPPHCSSFSVARKFWLPCHISKMLWTLVIVCNFLSSICLFNSKLFSVSTAPNAVQLPANILSLAQAICLTSPFSQSILPVASDCVKPIVSRPREKLASALTL